MPVTTWLCGQPVRSKLMADSYYKSDHLHHFGDIRQGQKELGDKFFEYYGSVFKDGALSEREKALIALAVSHALRCPYCIDAYTQNSLEKGADLEQMTEAVHVDTAIAAGSTLVYGMQMMEQVKQKGM